jgi:hypothetical protein
MEVSPTDQSFRMFLRAVERLSTPILVASRVVLPRTPVEALKVLVSIASADLMNLAQRFACGNAFRTVAPGGNGQTEAKASMRSSLLSVTP